MEDIGDLILYIACLPPRVCLNDVLITPTWNRAYISAQDQDTEPRFRGGYPAPQILSGGPRSV